MRVLMIGDIVGRPGRQALQRLRDGALPHPEEEKARKPAAPRWRGRREPPSDR